MKITTFNPLILTKESESLISLFEALGFERRHTITINTNGRDITNYRMKNADGYYVDIAQRDELPKDMVFIRMNVEDFDEAYETLLSQGFKNLQGEDHRVNTRTNKSAGMISPTGFMFNLCQHIKDL